MSERAACAAFGKWNEATKRRKGTKEAKMTSRLCGKAGEELTKYKLECVLGVHRGKL